MSASDISCAAIWAGGRGYIDGTRHTITGQPEKTQSGSSYVEWLDIPRIASFFLTVVLPSDYSLVNGCWRRTISAPTSGTGYSATFNSPGETLSFDVGAVAPGAWAQTEGGNVYAATNITSEVPSSAVPQLFNLDGASTYPGIVSYGSDYDFALGGSKGEGNISTKNWLVNETFAGTDYYNFFHHRFGSPTTADYTNPSSPIGKPASRTTPYYVVGDMTTSGNWAIGDGETIVMLVDGNATIGGNVTISGSGFFALIASGNITVSSSVGTTAASTTPVIEGVYITGLGGMFATGTSTDAAHERFVGRGIFVAGAFALQRSLEISGNNIDTAAELFLYNPRLLLTMPENMKDTSIIWQEVAP